jgi:predicted O-methyltransferase YrrM
MTEDLMLEFIEDLKAKRPDLQDVLDGVYEAHKLVLSQWAAIDQHYLYFPPGHFHSPLPSRQEFLSVAERAYGASASLLGVDLRVREQFRLFARLAKWHADFPFAEEAREPLRYYFNNAYFCHADAYWLYAMMREFRPKRIIEVGSGFSSAVMLDTNELFLDNETTCTFIEPNSERLLSLLRAGEDKRHRIYRENVQNVPVEVFSELQAGDFLFIDSSHVGKIGSDVLYLLQMILPSLEKNVFVHFHDIFYPFEYPREWHEKGWAWNECYIINAFLQYNSTFAIRLFGHFLGREHSEMLRKGTPTCLKNIGGSLWLEKLS